MQIKFDYRKLRGLIIEKYGTCASFARAMILSSGALSARLKNLTGWKDVEIYRACELLGIAPEEIPIYFFTPKF